MEDRVAKLEVIQEIHTEDIKELKTATYTLVDILKAIKNWLIGGVTLAVLQEVGLVEVLKKILF